METLTPAPACTCTPGGTLCATAPTLAAVTVGADVVTLTRHPRGVHMADYAPLQVNDAPMGELTGVRSEGGAVTARVRVHNGYDYLSLWRTAPTLADALTDMAPDIIRAYRRQYPASVPA